MPYNKYNLKIFIYKDVLALLYNHRQTMESATKIRKEEPKHIIEFAQAKKYIKLADHMLTQTYPLIKDPKLLLAVLDDVFLAFEHSMNSVLYCERYYKKIPPFHTHFESKFNVFKKEVVPRNQSLKIFVPIISDLQSLIIAHKRSPVEFVRKDKFVISTDDYKLKTISKEEMERKIKESKLFLIEVKKVLLQYEGSYK